MTVTKEDIIKILDKNCAESKKFSKMVIYVSLAALALAILAFAEKGILAALFLFCIGTYMLIRHVYELSAGKIKKETEYGKTLLIAKPNELVWAYVNSRTDKNQTFRSVILNFKSGVTLTVYEGAIPDNNVNFFITSLAVFNPQMHIGYSKDLEEKFKKRSLC